jgi:PST family polysaccharide transporter
MSLASRAIGLAGTILLARYLAPAEYGEVSAAGILVVTASTITTLGVGVYLVSTREVSRAEAFHVTCWFLAIGALALAIALAFSGPLGEWVGVPSLERFMPMFAIATLIERVIYVPEKMLVRKLRFRRLSIARACGELTFTAVSITLAAAGIGAMSIVYATIARATLRFLAIVSAVDRREWLEPHRLRLETMRRIAGYGINVSLAGVAAFGMRRWDNILVSRYFGSGVMATYNYAYNLADTPAVAVGEQMSDVVAASFPHVTGPQRQAGLVRSCTMISMIMFPLAFGLGVVAPTVASALFDQRWAGVGLMLAYLSVLSAARPVADIFVSYFYACERPRAAVWLEWSALIALVTAISTVGRISIEWTCTSVGAVFVLRTLGAMWVTRQYDGIPLSRFLIPLSKPLISCIAMVACVLAARPLLIDLAPLARLLIEVGLGAVVYTGVVLVVARTASREALALVRTVINRRASA